MERIRTKEIVPATDLAKEDVRRFLGQFWPEGERAAESLLGWATKFSAPPRTFVEGFITSGGIVSKGKTEVGIPNPQVPELITYLEFNPSTDSNEIEISQVLEIKEGSGLTRVVVSEGFKQVIQSVFDGNNGIILKGKDYALAVFGDGKVVFSESLFESNLFKEIKAQKKLRHKWSEL